MNKTALFRRNTVSRWMPALFMMAIIFTTSSMSGDLTHQLGFTDLILRKVLHVTGYALLGGTLFYAVKEVLANPYKAAWLMSVLYACSDEFHQSFVPGRSARLFDIGIDAAGAALGLLIFWQISRSKSRRSGS